MPRLPDSVRNKGWEGTASRYYATTLLIGYLPRRTKAAVPALVRTLQDKEPKVRLAAATVLANFGPDARPAIEPLTEALKDQDAGVRVQAAATLGRIDPKRTETMLAFIIRILREGESRDRLRAAYALGDLKSEAALAPLGKAVEDDNEEVRSAAVSALRKFGAKAAPAVPALIRALSDRSHPVRAEAAEALAHIGPTAKPAVRALMDALSDDEPDVRWLAAMALGAIGPEAKRAERILTATLQDDQPQVRVQAACALGRINPDQIGAITTRLVREMQNGDSAIRASAIGCLTVFGPRAKAAVDPLIKALKDSDAMVRVVAASALSEIDPEAARRAGVKERKRTNQSEPRP
jgi:HEAT repeat protein